LCFTFCEMVALCSNNPPGWWYLIAIVQNPSR
jgi:hypothetical protein